MATTIESLRKLGLKVNGEEPTSNNVGNVINEIANEYTGGGGGGTSIYTIDYSGATILDDHAELAITSAQAEEIAAQPAIILDFGSASEAFGADSILFNNTGSYFASTFIGGTSQNGDYIYCWRVEINSNILILTMLQKNPVENPMTAFGDLIVGGFAGAASRLGVGAAGQVLTVNAQGNNIEWATPASGGGSGIELIDLGTISLTYDSGNAYYSGTPTLTSTQVATIKAAPESIKFKVICTGTNEQMIDNIPYYFDLKACGSPAPGVDLILASGIQNTTATNYLSVTAISLSYVNAGGEVDASFSLKTGNISMS